MEQLSTDEYLESKQEERKQHALKVANDRRKENEKRYKVKYGKARKPPFHCADDGRTKQDQKNQTDINLLVAKYQKRGEDIPQSTRNTFADVSTIQDLQGNLNLLAEAEEAWYTLPSKTRNKFNNNRVDLIDFINNPNNYNEAVELGLIDKKVETPAEPAPLGDGGQATE